MINKNLSFLEATPAEIKRHDQKEWVPTILNKFLSGCFAQRLPTLSHKARPAPLLGGAEKENRAIHRRPISFLNKFHPLIIKVGNVVKRRLGSTHMHELSPLPLTHKYGLGTMAVPISQWGKLSL